MNSWNDTHQLNAGESVPQSAGTLVNLLPAVLPPYPSCVQTHELLDSRLPCRWRSVRLRVRSTLGKAPIGRTRGARSAPSQGPRQPSDPLHATWRAETDVGQLGIGYQI